MGEEKQNNRVKLDHLGYGIGVKYLKRPPKLPEDEVIDSMEDTLKEIVPDKLEELMDRQDEIKLIYEKKIQKLDEDSRLLEYMKVYFIESEHLGESEIINKWLKYWLRIARKIDKDIIFEPEFKNGIADEQIEQAKDSPIEDFYDDVLRGNERMVGVCPFHEEKTPSFTIFRNDNSFYCFGCHVSGDSIEYYMKLNNVGFIEAVKRLTNG